VVSLLFTSAAALYHKAEEPIPNSYIVKFNKDVTKDVISQHEQMFAENGNMKLERRYSFGNFFGYAATITDKTIISQIEQRPEVEFVSEDGMVYATHEEPQEPNACNTQNGATWGIARTSSQEEQFGEYSYPDSNDGSGVTAYVIDTGLRITHREFSGRARWGTNTIDSTRTDGNGHGTHCGGTIGGLTYGMAKRVQLVAVKVLSDAGSGSTQSVIAGVDWAVNDHVKPALGSMSLGGARNAALNSAIDSATQQGLIMIVAAGNEQTDACNRSPASAPTAITVAATENTDRRASFSNFGNCVSIFAPGRDITSAWINSDTAINTISGTSMACPHVAGQVAKFLQTFPSADAATTRSWLQSYGLQGVVQDSRTVDPRNRLLFADCATFDGFKSQTTVRLEKRYFD